MAASNGVKAIQQSQGSFEKSVSFIADHALARPLRSTETSVIKTTHATLLAFYDKQPDEAKKLLSIGETKADASIPVSQLAALTLIANQVLNLDEVLNK